MSLGYCEPPALMAARILLALRKARDGAPGREKTSPRLYFLLSVNHGQVNNYW
jgi:hypothetical protein